MIKLPNIAGLVKVGKTFIMARRPELLLGAAVTASVGGAVLAAKGGYEARGIIERERADRVLNGTEKWFGSYLEFSEAMDNAPQIPVKEQIQLTWLCYVPSAVAVTTSVASISGLHLVHVKDKKAMAQAALTAAEEFKTSLQSLEKGDKIGIITDEEQERLLEARAGEENGVARVVNSNGDVEELYLVRDGKTGRDIWSNKTRIEDAVNDLNSFINKNGDCELNTFYSLAGFEATPDGDDWGWSGELVSIKWDTITRDDGRPVRRFTFHTKPKEDFERRSPIR